MPNTNDPDLTRMLNHGWDVAGYSTCLSALGVITHHVLLRNGSSLKTFMVAIQGGSEQGRTMNTLSPAPPKKKGWFG